MIDDGETSVIEQWKQIQREQCARIVPAKREPMREFFNGWRRKAGVVTLVMACVFAAMVYAIVVGRTIRSHRLQYESRTPSKSN